jgi:hypothetical protein
MTSIELRVEDRGIPHLAKNERDVGHPASVAGIGNPVISLPTQLQRVVSSGETRAFRMSGPDTKHDYLWSMGEATAL